MAEATYGTITILACPANQVRAVRTILAEHLADGYADLDEIELDWDYESAPAGVRATFADAVTAALARLRGVTAIVSQDPAFEWDGEQVVIHDGEIESRWTNNVGAVIVPAHEIETAISEHGHDLDALMAKLRDLVGETPLWATVRALRDSIPSGTTVPVPPAPAG